MYRVSYIIIVTRVYLLVRNRFKFGDSRHDQRLQDGLHFCDGETDH